MPIWMVDHGSLSVGFFDLVIIGCLLHTKDLVKIFTLGFLEFKLGLLQKLPKE